MKKSLALLVPALFVAAIGATSDAGAQPQVKPGVIVNPLRFAPSTVKGTITLPAPIPANFPNFSCSNLAIYAQSQAMNAPAGGGFASPKWTRHGNVTTVGNTCAYSMSIPSGQAFFLSLAGSGSYACDVITPITSSAAGPFNVPAGQSQDHNFVLSNVVCEVLH